MKSKNKLLVYSALFVIAILLVSFLGQYIAPYDPTLTDLGNTMKTPNSHNWFGTDKLGRDIFSRILAGAPTTVYSALLVTLCSFGIGTFLGITAAYFGKTYEKAVMSFTTLFQAFPKFALIVTLAGLLGSSLKNSVIALILVCWVPYVRISRSLVLTVKDCEYVRAAQICGAGRMRILLFYILPNVIEPLIVTSMLEISGAILNLASLSYLGLGTPSPAIEWGSMISEAKATMLQAPWSVIIPGIAIFIVVSAFNYFGEKLSEAIYNI